MDPNRRKTQPGPALEPRVIAVPTHARPMTLVLPPGRSLLDTLHEALGNCPSAIVHLESGAFGPTTYVIPALSKTTKHAAFYSDLFTPPGHTTIDAARITYGLRDGQPWLHCHGFWIEACGRHGGGHIIPDHTILATPVAATAWRLDGAVFCAKPDPETNFSLLAPEASGPPGPCHAIRLRPNQDLCTTLEDFCAQKGITHATIAGGVASIIGAVFDDGRISTPFATEIFIRSGNIDTACDGKPAATIEIGLVNFQGEILRGTLLRGANPVLMTAELLLIPR